MIRHPHILPLLIAGLFGSVAMFACGDSTSADNVADDDTEKDASSGTDETGADAAKSDSGRVVEKSECSVTKTGTVGKLFKAILLLLETVEANGELLIDDSGTIVCAAASCASTRPI